MIFSVRVALLIAVLILVPGYLESARAGQLTGEPMPTLITLLWMGACDRTVPH